MLILFDIDGTLLKSQRAGITAFIQALAEMSGRAIDYEGRRFAGSMDPLIWRSLCAENGLSGIDEGEFRVRYRRLLEQRLATGIARALPGVIALLDALRDHVEVTVGVMTGNYSDTGRMKLAAVGIAPERFAVGAWGEDGAHRRELPLVALARCRDHVARTYRPADVIVIGDTPHDVDCASANGCRSLAVATGPFVPDELRAAGADHVVEDLADTESLLRWFFERGQ